MIESGGEVTTEEDPGGPVMLVGEANEDWTGDAVFYEYSQAADPIAGGSTSRIPVHRFGAELHAGGPSRLVPLDLSGPLGVEGPATSPALLASFVVLDGEHPVVTRPDATSELYYCLSGAGRSQFTQHLSDRAPVSGCIEWAEGDVVVLPAGCTVVHSATGTGPPAGAPAGVLYRVTDAPLLHYLGVSASEPRFSPTRFDRATAAHRLAEVAEDPGAADRSRVSILLGNLATPQTLTATHTLWAMIGVLPAGRVQRPHRHQSVALDLITDCAPGCYSLLGSELGPAGEIVDPVRVDWEAGGAFVTPPGLWHSHHNESDRPAYLVPVQDAGLQTYLRSLDIRFAPVDR